jgi:NAD(P)-dependent dehydrogenase (short-subunit alcohol dehydrogenase family)
MAERTILVIGGASGIGSAICHRAHSDGWQVISMDLNPQTESPWSHIAVDIRDTEALSESMREIRNDFGALSALHITAGVVDPTPIPQISIRRVHDILLLNVVGAIDAVSQCAGLIRSHGSIVLFSSIAARRGGGFFGASTYAASKAAIEGLTRGLARELASRGIRVNCVVPGPTNTPMLMTAPHEVIAQVGASTLLERIAEPREIAGAALFLSGPDASFITGAVLTVDGGASLK